MGPVGVNNRELALWLIKSNVSQRLQKLQWPKPSFLRSQGRVVKQGSAEAGADVSTNIICIHVLSTAWAETWWLGRDTHKRLGKLALRWEHVGRSYIRYHRNKRNE